MPLLLYALIGLLAGFIVSYMYETVIPIITRKKSLIINGYKLHHSLYGILLILIPFIWSNSNSQMILFITSGIGVIAEHYFTGGGLDFVTKEAN